jgi:molybdopterin/thiamine biosynthesis adenylyltransferase
MSTLHRALLIGAGGLGCPVLLGMADQVCLTIVDPDVVDVSNLQRQILYRSDDVGRPKVECVLRAIRQRYPNVRADGAAIRLDRSNGAALIAGHDVVIDGSDSFDTKFLVNDLCLRLGVPLVHGAVTGLTGQLMTVMGDHSCYRCIFEGPPDDAFATTCTEAGVLGPLCGVIGGRMAREAIAVLAGLPTLAGTMRIYDARTAAWRDMKPRRRETCPAHYPAEVATW